MIVGFGVTGQSVAQHFASCGEDFLVADDALNPKKIPSNIKTCALSEMSWTGLDNVMVSPGVPLRHVKIREAYAAGATLSNDVQLFSSLCDKPLALITGSNGKSTVTHYVGQLLKGCGLNVGVGGNIGVPALSILGNDRDAYVVEVSSYHLELATEATATVGALLNLSPDHLDRYDSVENYYRTKMNVFNCAEVAVLNRSILADVEFDAGTRLITFGLDEAEDGHYGIVHDGQQDFVSIGAEKLIAVNELPVSGAHQVQNLMAALIIAQELGADMNALLHYLPELSGLEHRFETLPRISSRLVVNDSKSTNPASTLAAIESFPHTGNPLVLMLGGLGKGGDFSLLTNAIASRVSYCFLYGQDRLTIHDQLLKGLTSEVDGRMAVNVKFDVQQTVSDCLAKIAELDSVDVLFSPGCASQDQFKNFEERGRDFKRQAGERFV